MSVSDMRIGQPDLTLNETLGRDVRAESACNVRFTRPDALTSIAEIKTAWRALASTRLHVRSSSIGGFLGYTACVQSFRRYSKEMRCRGRGEQKRTEQGSPCNSIVAAHLFARPSLTEMHDRRWWLTSVARDHYGGNKTARRRIRLDDHSNRNFCNVTIEG